jgi:putative transposase
LRRAQRSVSRKKKGSNDRRKAILRLKKIHQRIINRRDDFQHKVSKSLIQNFDIICLERLNISGMSKGTLPKQIHDVSWSSFFNKLKYKAESADKQLKEVSPNHTSQDFSACGERIKKDLSVRVHHCFTCGLSIHRDINAAINILSLGLSNLDLTKTVGL